MVVAPPSAGGGGGCGGSSTTGRGEVAVVVAPPSAGGTFPGSVSNDREPRRLAQPPRSSEEKRLRHPNPPPPTSTVVCVFHAADSPEGDPTSGWIEMMPHSDMGGPDGMVIEWRVPDKSPHPKMLGDRAPSARGTSFYKENDKRSFHGAPPTTTTIDPCSEHAIPFDVRIVGGGRDQGRALPDLPPPASPAAALPRHGVRRSGRHRSRPCGCGPAFHRARRVRAGVPAFLLRQIRDSPPTVEFHAQGRVGGDQVGPMRRPSPTAAQKARPGDQVRQEDAVTRALVHSSRHHTLLSLREIAIMTIKEARTLLNSV